MSRSPTTRVSRACKDAGKTLEYLQQSLGIDVRIITQKAHGQGRDGKNLKRFTQIEIAKIADLLGIPPKWLAGGGDADRIPSVFCGEKFDKSTHRKWNEITEQLAKLDGEYFDDVCDAMGYFSLISIRTAVASAVRGNRLFELMARIDELVKEMAIPPTLETTTSSAASSDTRHPYVLEPNNKPAALLYHVALKYLDDALDKGAYSEPGAGADELTRSRINACLLKLQSENRRFQLQFVFNDDEDLAESIWLTRLGVRYVDLTCRLDSETFAVTTETSTTDLLREFNGIKKRIKASRSKERSLKRNSLKVGDSGVTERIPTPPKGKKSKAPSASAVSAAGASQQVKKRKSKRVKVRPVQVKAPRRRAQTIPINKTSENQRPGTLRKTAPREWTGKAAAGGKDTIRAKRRGGRDAGKTIKKPGTKPSEGQSPRKKRPR